MKKYNLRVSQFTKMGFVLCIFGIIVQLYIGFRHFSGTEYEQAWSRICLLEALFGIIGLLSIDLIMGTYSGIIPKNFKSIISRKIDSKKSGPNIIFKTLVALATLLLIQIVCQATLTIEDSEKAMAILFCSVCEELFFRGTLMATFLKIGSYSKKIRISKKNEIAPVTIMGIIFQAYLFAAMHINYYDNIPVLMAMFFSGIALGIYMWLWKDITSLILAHFGLNFIYVFRFFWMFTL